MLRVPGGLSWLPENSRTPVVLPRLLVGRHAPLLDTRSTEPPPRVESLLYHEDVLPVVAKVVVVPELGAFGWDHIAQFVLSFVPHFARSFVVLVRRAVALVVSLLTWMRRQMGGCEPR